MKCFLNPLTLSQSKDWKQRHCVSMDLAMRTFWKDCEGRARFATDGSKNDSRKYTSTLLRVEGEDPEYKPRVYFAGFMEQNCSRAEYEKQAAVDQGAFLQDNQEVADRSCSIFDDALDGVVTDHAPGE
mmetsp:Transcript_66184/g.137908  ORF Transcript_66184/g.137908 Transcript_66184/m.137908 type:complete len:128 (+) Transcript_66184:71-454(+)